MPISGINIGFAYWVNGKIYFITTWFGRITQPLVIAIAQDRRCRNCDETRWRYHFVGHLSSRGLLRLSLWCLFFFWWLQNSRTRSFVACAIHLMTNIIGQSERSCGIERAIALLNSHSLSLRLNATRSHETCMTNGEHEKGRNPLGQEGNYYVGTASVPIDSACSLVD